MKYLKLKYSFDRTCVPLVHFNSFLKSFQKKKNKYFLPLSSIHVTDTLNISDNIVLQPQLCSFEHDQPEIVPFCQNQTNVIDMLYVIKFLSSLKLVNGCKQMREANKKKSKFHKKVIRSVKLNQKKVRPQFSLIL